jgi:purine-binding chemotaxis protein CheW
LSKKKKTTPSQPPILPPSGLAEDVLNLLEDDVSSLENGAQQGSERIYDFADSVQSSGDREAEEQIRFEKWVLFMLGAETFGLPVTHVREVLRVSDITRVPHAPHPVRGVINMRGHILPVVDTRRRIGLAESDLTGQSRILVAEAKGRLIGLLVDSVHNVFPLDPSRIEPPPPDVMTVSSNYLTGVYNHDDHVLILLDPEKVFLVHGESEA